MYPMQNALADIRYVFRLLAKTPGFTAAALLTLALGIGANASIFSVIDAVLLRDLPFEEPDRLVMVWEHNQQRQRNNVVSPANFDDWRGQSASFESLVAFATEQANLTGSGEPERLNVQLVSPGFFDMLGTRPFAGRALTPEDDAAEAAPVVVLSDGLWRRRFGSDADIVGSTIMLDGQAQTVVGVMPRDFHLTIKEYANTTGRADLWVPARLSALENQRGRFLTVAGRLKPGVAVEDARVEMEYVAARLREQYPQFNRNISTNVVPLRDQLVGNVRPALLVLSAAVGLMLLIACANVANLLLMRAATRRREIAIRSALGAGRLRVVRQLLTESLCLSVLGGLLGLVLALWGTDLLLALAPADLLGVADVHLDARVLAFTAAVSVATGFVFGLVPAVQASKVDLNSTLKESGRHGTADRAAARLSRLLVVSEVALAVVLLVGAGLLLRSFMGLRSVDPGFRPEGVVTARVELPSQSYPEDSQQIGFFRSLLERVRAMPGVRSASAVSTVPFGGLGSRTRMWVEGRPAPAPGEEARTDVSVIDPAYFETMSIPVLEGRTFTQHEAQAAAHVVVVSELLAREQFPNESAVGRRIRVNMGSEPQFCEIVGVVGDVRHRSLEDPLHPMVYWPHPELVVSGMTVVIRADGDSGAVLPMVMGAVREMDPNLPVSSLRTLESWMSDSLARSRFTTTLLAIFGFVAFVLSVIGIYGVLSYAVALRTQEIGIRMALGARRSDVVGMVLRDGLRLAIPGLAVGIVAAVILNRFIASLLYGVEGTDAATYVAASVLFLGVAIVACTLPARRASSVDPVVALR
jgi:putative ABC transport system permease protein